MNLAGKTAVITGGGTGIGYGIAVALAGLGCRVAITGRRAEKLDEAAERWNGQPAMLQHVVDVADRQSVAKMFAWATSELGQINILVHSAGINIRDRTMAAMAPDEWDQVIAVNATGAYNCIHAVYADMVARGDGLIVNINSVAGKRAVPVGGVAYNASKFAMTALGTSVANEAAQHGVRVTNVFPGEVNTPILDQRPVKVSDEHRAAILQPEDIASVVAAIALLHPRAHVPELVIKPLKQSYV